jgi:trehalose/maltose hydrolase-like predicted phosphorylase
VTECAKSRGGWTVNSHGASSVEETLFALADGVVGVRANLEEQRSFTAGAFIASVFEQTPIHYHERLPGFAESSDTRIPVVNGMRLGVEASGQALGHPDTRLESCDWTLDLRSGTVTRMSIWLTSHGRLEIRSDRVMPGRPGASIALRYTVRSIDFVGDIRIASWLDVTSRNTPGGGDPRIGVDLAGGGLRLVATGVQDDVTYCVQKTSRSGVWVAAAQAHHLASGLQPGDAGLQDTETPTALVPAEHFAGVLQQGEALVLEKFVTYAAGNGSPSDAELADLRARAAAMARASFDHHVTFRRETLDAQWPLSDIRIAGDDACDRALRFNAFHLQQSASLDPRFSTSAKGLTGEGYEGHAFWDTEAFVVPALVCSAPRLARAALDARIGQLVGARANARALNHPRGALYPWRTIAGQECSSHYPSGSAQYHINAAIAQAVELYVTATSDETLLLDGGAELLWETARIWLDVGTFSSAHGGQFCIFGVTGPDEYSALVDNNYYTNRMAALHLKYAAQVYFELADRHPDAWEQLTARLELDRDEVQSWLAASTAMHLPYDATLAIDAQDERFLAKPRLVPVSTNGEPLLLTYHPLTLYRHQVSKQADLILAMAFAGDAVPRDRLQRNLAYYETVTTHDSTLSACAYAIVAAKAGLPTKALEYFRRAAFVDLDNLQGNVAHGSHMAALAGSLLAIQWGFAGMTWRGGALGFRPVLPESWTSVTFKLLWRGRLIEVAIHAEKVTYALLQGEPLEIFHFGEPFLLQATVDREYPSLLAEAT